MPCFAKHIGSAPGRDVGQSKTARRRRPLRETADTRSAFSDLRSLHIAAGERNVCIGFAFIRERGHILVHFRDRSVPVYAPAQREQQNREQNGQHGPADPFGRFAFCILYSLDTPFIRCGKI